MRTHPKKLQRLYLTIEKPKKLEVVLVDWIDATINNHEWREGDRIVGGARLLHSGFVIGEDRNFLILGMEVTHSTEEPFGVRRNIAIPKPNIVRRMTLWRQ